MRIQTPAIIHRVLDAVRGVGYGRVRLSAPLRREPRWGIAPWAAALLLAALSLGVGVAQAQQASSAEIAALTAEVTALREDTRVQQAKNESEFKLLRSDMHSELKLLRAYIDTAIAQSETRMIIRIVGFNFALAAFLLAVLPFYIALLRRVMPGLFGPVPRRRSESGGGRDAERSKIDAHHGAGA